VLRATLVVALFVVAAPAQDRVRQTDRQIDGLAGRVKRVVTSEATAGRPAQPVEASVYDVEGRLVERTVYAAGAETARITFTYDALGVRHVRASKPDGIGLGQWHTRLRPREQPPMPFERGADGMYAFVTVRAYDTAGRVINEAIHTGTETANKPLLARVIYRYNPQGQLSERLRFYGMPGAPVDKEVYTYGPDGKVAESVQYRLANVLPTKRTFAYESDASGNWTKRTETLTLAGAPVVVVATRKIEYF
jgi:hypothetical protein